jgi:hypothetical protein
MREMHHFDRFGEFFGAYAWLLPVIIILALWSGVWRLIGLWKAGRNNEMGWFICIALINTLGILPIIYLIIQKNKKTDTGAIDSGK